MYAPFGAGVLSGPRAAFATGDPFLAGGGAVDLVDLDEVVWTDPPDREEAGSPNVMGAIALHQAIEELTRLGWTAIVRHEEMLAAQLHNGLRGLPGVRVLGPPEPGLAVASFVVDGMSHALVASRLSSEHGIGVRHGCFCAHPYLLRLLDLSPAEVARYRADVLSGDRREIPGAVRASAGISTTSDDIGRFLGALEAIITSKPDVRYTQDPSTGDYFPDVPGWTAQDRAIGATCARG